MTRYRIQTCTEVTGRTIQQGRQPLPVVNPPVLDKAGIGENPRPNPPANHLFVLRSCTFEIFLITCRNVSSESVRTHSRGGNTPLPHYGTGGRQPIGAGIKPQPIFDNFRKRCQALLSQAFPSTTARIAYPACTTGMQMHSTTTERDSGFRRIPAWTPSTMSSANSPATRRKNAFRPDL